MKEVRNAKIREEIKKRNLYLWQVAEMIGICQTTFLIWMRSPLSPEREQRVTEALKRWDEQEQEKGQEE